MICPAAAAADENEPGDVELQLDLLDVRDRERHVAFDEPLELHAGAFGVERQPLRRLVDRAIGALRETGEMGLARIAGRTFYGRRRPQRVHGTI